MVRKEAVPHARVKAQVDGLERILDLEPRSRVLDLCCGTGRRTLELARRGHRVLGADADEKALAHARASAKGEKLNAHFVQAEPHAIAYRADLDAIVFLDGAFGRGAGDRDDLRALECARKALKPGAKLVLDLLNRERLMRHFGPDFRDPDEEDHGAVVLEHLSFDFEKGRLERRRTHAGTRAPETVSARLYALTELIALLERAGLAYRKSWGGWDGEPYALDSARLVVLAEKPLAEKPRVSPDDGLPKALRIKGRR